VAQEIEHLPNKLKSPSSKPNTLKKKMISITQQTLYSAFIYNPQTKASLKAGKESRQLLTFSALSADICHTEMLHELYIE
jgi:hypothetical protein